MFLDFTSLLLATGFSGACLGLTMFAFWLSARSESFMITWAAGLMVIAAHVFAYWYYVQVPRPWLGALVVALLPVGLAIIHAAALQFVGRARPLRRVLALSLPYLAIVLALMAGGLDGAALMVQNAAAFVILVATGLVYWDNRAESPAFMSLLSGLYVVLGSSFGLCGLVLLIEWRLSIGHAPDNWAERLNIVVSVACMSGMGALSLALNQARLARRHRSDAMTDPLTGLLNRRALFRIHGDRDLDAFCAVIMFDLDRFKQINDLNGHAIGDEIIRKFAAALSTHSRARDDAVRLGGEEFALVMRRVTADKARRVAERVATAFAGETVHGPAGPVRATVSAGIGFGDAAGASLEAVMTRADRALYEAKRAGRNRIEAGSYRLAG